jgi:hypothetical protein
MFFCSITKFSFYILFVSLHAGLVLQSFRRCLLLGGDNGHACFLLFYNKQEVVLLAALYEQILAVDEVF